jgi:type I restriction enzyme S subunit
MGSEWLNLRLGDICDFQNGFSFKSTDYKDKNDGDTYEVLKMGHIKREGGFQSEDKPSFVPKSLFSKIGNFVLSKGDIVIAMTDMKSSMALLGHTAQVPESNKYVLNQRVGRIRVSRNDLLDQR